MDTLVLLQMFLEYALLFLEIKRKKTKQIIFNKQKFSLRVLLTFRLNFFANFSLVLLTAYPKCWKTHY